MWVDLTGGACHCCVQRYLDMKCQTLLCAASTDVCAYERKEGHVSDLSKNLYQRLVSLQCRIQCVMVFLTVINLQMVHLG